jgi:hypothetical protein
MKCVRTAEFASAVTYALLQKLSEGWRRPRGYRDLLDIPDAVANRLPAGRLLTATAITQRGAFQTPS